MTQQRPFQPAVLIGGPPHTGKSVLTYSLTRALRQYGVAHYVLRACPDGEGHWSQEAPQQIAEAIRRKGTFSDTFIQRVCADIERRQLPFIVDVGGLPQGEQFQIFQRCTHAILLRHCDRPERIWDDIVERNRLKLLADLVSELNGAPVLEAQDPILRGTLTGLQRGTAIQGQPFDSLVECLVTLFVLASKGLSEAHTMQAPTDLVLNLPQILDCLSPGNIDWTPELLPLLLENVPVGTPLSVYGRAPHWVYTALFLHTKPAPFYQFDARLGWLRPLPLQPGSDTHPEIAFEAEMFEDCLVLHCTMHNQNLDYRSISGLHVPVLPPSEGLILNGKLPLWLASALAGCYQQGDFSWLAAYYPQKHGAVVVSSHTPHYLPGDLVPIALTP